MEQTVNEYMPIPSEQEWTENDRQWFERVRSLEAEVKRLRDALSSLYDKWENGVSCHETTDGVVDDDSTPIGNAFKLSFEEEQTILNLIVTKAEEWEQRCANCSKPYRAHLLHVNNKCSPDSTGTWFPSSIAAALAAQQAPAAKGE